MSHFRFKRDRPRGYIPAYNPVSQLGNVALWLRADKGVTLNTGQVTTWNDQSGIGDSGRNFSTVTDRPDWNATDALYNNQPTIGTFNKAGSANNCALRSGIWSNSYTNFTVIVFGHSIASSSRYFSSQSNNNFCSLSTENLRTYMFYGSGSAGPNSAIAPIDAPKLMIGEYNGASSKLFVDAVLTASATGTVGGSTIIGDAAHTVGTWGGSGGTGATTWGVEALAEVIVLNGAWSVLTSDQKIGFRNYINARYAKSINT